MNELIKYKGQRKIIDDRYVYRTVGLVMFLVAVGLIVMRIVMYFASIQNEAVADTLFSVTMQMGILLVMPFLMYKLRLKKSIKEVLSFSNFNKPKWFNVLLAIPIGICAYVVSLGVSTVWQSFLIMLGYKHSSSAGYYPDAFNAGLFILSIFLTAVLPGICEEFTNRGGFLTMMRKTFSDGKVILICGVAFGLFHQNITQVFYTACFGAFMAFLTIKCRTAVPAVIIHFTNNALSVYFEYGEQYDGWFLGNLGNLIQSELLTRPLLIMICYLLVAFLLIGLVVILLRLNGIKKLEKKKELMLDAGFDHTNNRVVLMGAENKALVEEIDMVKEVYGSAYVADEKFKPTLRDNAFYIGAAALAVITTIFSFVWGLIA